MKSILIADDNALVRRALRLLFEEQGWEVCGEAADGKEAIRQAEELRPDIAVLDLSMPMMNGLNVGRILKRNIPEIHMVLFTSFGDLVTPEEVSLSGFSALVQKGEAGKLVGEIQKLLDSIRLARAS